MARLCSHSLARFALPLPRSLRVTASPASPLGADSHVTPITPTHTYIYIHTQKRDKEKHTHKRTHILYIYTHKRETKRHTHTQKHTQTHTDTHTNTHTHTHTHTHLVALWPLSHLSQRELCQSSQWNYHFLWLPLKLSFRHTEVTEHAVMLTSSCWY